MDISKTLHLAIDVQERYTDNLGKSRGEEYADEVRITADILRDYHIKTLWVATPLTRNSDHGPNRIVKEGLSSCWKKAFTELSKLKLHSNYDLDLLINPNLGLSDVRNDEAVFLKYVPGAFVFDMDAIWVTAKGAVQSGVGLADYLKRNGYNHVLISGMNASQCVAATIDGALDYGLAVTVLTDVLADARRWDNTPSSFDVEAYAAFQQGLVQKNLKTKNLSKLSYTTSDGLYSFLDLKSKTTLLKPTAAPSIKSIAVLSAS